MVGQLTMVNTTTMGLSALTLRSTMARPARAENELCLARLLPLLRQTRWLSDRENRSWKVIAGGAGETCLTAGRGLEADRLPIWGRVALDLVWSRF